MEGLPGEAEELGPDYDKRSYVGERLVKLDLDTQSDVSRRTAAIILFPEIHCTLWKTKMRD